MKAKYLKIVYFKYIKSVYRLQTTGRKSDEDKYGSSNVMNQTTLVNVLEYIFMKYINGTKTAAFVFLVFVFCSS